MTVSNDSAARRAAAEAAAERRRADERRAQAQRAAQARRAGESDIQRQARNFVDLARKQVGFHEGANNDNKYAAIAGHGNNQYWCATFVTAMLKHGGVMGGAKPAGTIDVAGSPAVNTVASQFQQQGRFIQRGGNPQPGDIIFFRLNSGHEHIGIVESVKDGVVHTIEGNSGDAVSRRTWSVNDGNISGYGRTFGGVLPGEAAGAAGTGAPGAGASTTDGSGGVASSGGGSVSSGGGSYGGGNATVGPTTVPSGYNGSPLPNVEAAYRVPYQSRALLDQFDPVLLALLMDNPDNPGVITPQALALLKKFAPKMTKGQAQQLHDLVRTYPLLGDALKMNPALLQQVQKNPKAALKGIEQITAAPNISLAAPAADAFNLPVAAPMVVPAATDGSTPVAAPETAPEGTEQQIAAGFAGVTIPG